MPDKHTNDKPPPGYRYVYVKQFRHWRSGKLIVASDYGHDAFRFTVRC
jgi:hypothetical protein